MSAAYMSRREDDEEAEPLNFSHDAEIEDIEAP